MLDKCGLVADILLLCQKSNNKNNMHLATQTNDAHLIYSCPGPISMAPAAFTIALHIANGILSVSASADTLR